MSDASNNNSGSFSHAFLPGLILGLVIGAGAGAFLPDLMGGNRIPTPTGETDPNAPATRDGQDPMTDDQIQEIIDDAEGTAEDLIDDATNAAEDLIDDAEDALPSDVPSTPPSDG